MLQPLTTTSGACLDEAQALDLLDEHATTRERSAALAHVDACRACRELVGVLATELDAFEATDGEVPRGQLVGRYVVLDRVGQGGMGTVYAAYDPALDRKVAVKIVRVDRAADTSLAERLVREAQAMGQLTHPHVTRVYDAGRDGDRVFIAMELVDGGTLTDWLRERPRGWREIVRAFVAAGRGLAAAHAVGMVHRDFKPDNVLCALDGRVSVTDFGLARTRDDGPESASGRVLGTPAYMAPEQRAGLAADALSDQYSFAASLFEALWGLPAPRDRVPAALRPLVERALAEAPELRYGDLVALLAALERFGRRAPRRRLMALGTLLALGGVAAGATMRPAASSKTPAPCSGAAAPIAEVWNDARRARVESALGASPATYAATTRATVLAALDRHATRWRKLSRDVCLAGVRREQTDAVADLKRACLDTRLGELDQATAALADGAVSIDRAVQVATSLTPLDVCDDAAALSARVPPPADPAVATRARQLTTAIAHVKLDSDAGRYAKAMADARGIRDEARTLGVPALVAQATFRMGIAAMNTGAIADAEQAFYDALWAAEAAHDDELAALSWSVLTFVVGYAKGDAAEGDRILAHAHAAVARLTATSPRLGAQTRAKLLGFESTIAFARGDAARAVALGAETLPALIEIHGADALEVLRFRMNQAANLSSVGKLDEALAEYDRADATLRRVFGDGHPDQISLDSNRALVLERLGRHEEADVILTRTVATARATLGPSHPTLMTTLVKLADVRLARRHPDEALAYLDEADVVRAQLPPGTAQERVRSMTLRGDVLRALDRLRDAEKVLRAALALGEQELGPTNATLEFPITGLAIVARRSGRLAEAKRLYARAIAIASQPGADPTRLEDLKQSLELTKRLRPTGPNAPASGRRRSAW